MSDLDYPSDLRYTSDHEWVRVGDDGAVRIGITSFAQDALGDVVFVQLPELDQDVDAGAKIAEVESTKSVSDIYAPVSGEITAVNEEIADNAGIINEDPYEAGWLYEVTVTEVGDLLDHEAYAADNV